MKELIRGSFDGSDEDVEEVIEIVFDGDDEDLERLTASKQDDFRDSLRAILVSTEFIIFE